MQYTFQIDYRTVKGKESHSPRFKCASSLELFGALMGLRGKHFTLVDVMVRVRQGRRALWYSCASSYTGTSGRMKIDLERMRDPEYAETIAVAAFDEAARLWRYYGTGGSE